MILINLGEQFIFISRFLCVDANKYSENICEKKTSK